jgi:LPS sulfotransferase NodH
MNKLNLDLSSCKFDFESFTPANRIAKLLICTTPRTAGHALSYLMYKNGWGVPAEYFHPNLAKNLHLRWSGEDCEHSNIFKQHLNDYRSSLIHYRVRNNIFSAKIFPQNHFHFRKCFGTKNTKYILLSREDRFSQLVSLLALYMTGRPYDNEHVTQNIPRINKLSEKEIDQYFRLLTIQEDYWQKFSEGLSEDQKINITSECLLDDPIKTIKNISIKLNIEMRTQTATQNYSVGEKYQQDSEIKHEIIRRYGLYIQKILGEKK